MVAFDYYKPLGLNTRVLGVDHPATGAGLIEAIAMAGVGDTIFLPPGTYDLGSDGINWPYGVSLVGLGHWRQTIVTGTDAYALIELETGRCRFENIWFKNTNGATTQAATNNAFAIHIHLPTTMAWEAQAAVAKWSRVLIDSGTKIAVCTTAGTTGASEPTWSTADNGTTADGTAVWTTYPSDSASDIVFDKCGFNSTGVCVSSLCGDRQTIQNSVFTGWGEIAIIAATGHYESTQTPPRHGLTLRNIIAENAMAIPSTSSGVVGFLKQTDRTVFADNVLVSMSCAADLGTGGSGAGKVVGFWKTSGTATILRAVNCRVWIGGSANNNESLGFLNDKAGGSTTVEAISCVVDGATSHADGLRFFRDTFAALAGCTWNIHGGNITPTNWTKANSGTVVNILPTYRTSFPTLADSAAPSGTLYVSSDQSNKLVFKDAGGTVNVLY